MRRNKLSRIYVGVVMVCGINNNAMRNVEGSGRRGRRPLQMRCHRFRVLAVFIFNFQVAFGVRHRVLCPRLRIHKIHNAHPRFDTSSLQPVPETHLGFTKSQGLYVPASIKTLSTYTRKVPFLLHKKCNNCRNVAKLKHKSFVCTIC